ncbi:hypothetical protein JXA80_08865, partial [bacterium]|nr:hypothetical protein [candidate division CSSED10-310 bacterium]
GGRPEARHSLGMAKPYGFGQVELAVELLDIHANRDPVPDLDECERRFVAAMENHITGWAESIEIRALLDMADPNVSRPHELMYPVLGRGRGNNQFVEYTKKELRYTLREFVTRRSDHVKNEQKGVKKKVSIDRLDQLVERAVNQPTILTNPKSVGGDLANWVTGQDITVLQKALIEQFIKTYPERVAAWRQKAEKTGRGIWKDIESLAQSLKIDIQ